MNTRPKDGHAYTPTDCEHIANTVTHGVSISWHTEQVLDILLELDFRPSLHTEQVLDIYQR